MRFRQARQKTLGLCLQRCRTILRAGTLRRQSAIVLLRRGQSPFALRGWQPGRPAGERLNPRMRLPSDTIIARRKVSDYLLVSRPEDDKSAFLAGAGYVARTEDLLLADLRTQLLPMEARLLEHGEYGTKYAIDGKLTGPNGRTLRVVSIWMIEHAGGKCKFVTLYPRKT